MPANTTWNGRCAAIASEPLDVAEQQVWALVAGHAAGEADDRNVGAQPDAAVSFT